ncbi:MAG TPA: phosphoenolpyruvate--protein phosphotransferase [Candidatus Limnocylindria bacterium]|nr:phosphoenolpyruvate--protein phosphotransferase [Candidatus Limnocylindria bacterium]
MRRLRGIAAAPGVAAAPPYRLAFDAGPGGARLDLDAAVEVAVAQLDALAARLAAAGRPDEGAIFDAQALLAQDEELLGAARTSVAAGEGVDAAVVAAGEEAATMLAALDDETLAARAADVRDVAARIARAARGEAPPRLERPSVLVAADVAPSITAELDRSLLAGIALEGGSRTSHAAILARALGIPAVVGIPGLLAAVEGAGELIVDGTSGEVIVEPDAAARGHAIAAGDAHRAQLARDLALATQPLALAGGHRLVLAANIGSPEEAARAVAAGAEAVGLFRTEFAFLERAAAPDEATQAAAYASVLRTLGPRPVVMRLLDVGGDKPLPYLPMPVEANPFLGVRAIRLVHAHREIMATQLRAILRASRAAGVAEPRIMAPMVADLADLREVRGLLDEALAATGGDGVAPRLGIMVEVPSAVLVADQLAREAAFFSVGTNDLTQYLLAADRTNPALAERQDPLHPAVLRAIARVVAAAGAGGIEVAVCGEMGGDPAGALLLAGLGVDELSMDAGAFGGVKRALAGVTLAEARSLAGAALELDDAAAVRRLVGVRVGTA